MSSLYELTGAYLELEDMLLDEEIDEQTVLDTLEGVKGEIEIKAEGYVKVLRSIESQAEAYAKEAEAFAKKAKTAKNRAESLKKALFNAMTEMDLPEIKTDLFKLKIVGNGGLQPLKIDIPAEELPPIFQKVTITADTEKIRGMLAKGEEVTKEYPWAHLEPRGRRLSIK